MISRVLRLTGTAVELALSLAAETLEVARALVVESPRGRRALLAANLLKGNPTAYRIDVRDGGLMVAPGVLMTAECTFTSETPRCDLGHSDQPFPETGVSR